MKNVVSFVEVFSIADTLGINAGDVLLEINGKPVIDVFDYRYLMQDQHVELLIRKPSGEEIVFEAEKDEFDDLGLSFESGLMDSAKSCSNKCIFCFIDQLPKGMRPTLYFKDDDSRLSFLSGNYVTLTNMSPSDMDRIAFYHLSPINISVHAANSEIRCKMLNNRKAGDLFEKMDKLSSAGITMNCQVVLCKGINDKEQLDFTISRLSKYIPQIESLSVVPAGLTMHREGLSSLESFDKADALHVIKQIEGWQEKFRRMDAGNFVYASDEFYLKAEIPFPYYEDYYGFPQLENGVGMIPLFEYELDQALKRTRIKPGSKWREKSLSLVTGEAAADFMRGISRKLHDFAPRIHLDVIPVENRFFGSSITVSGLLTGRDIVYALKGKKLGEAVLIPGNALRGSEFLDDMTLQEMSETLGVQVLCVETSAAKLLRTILRLP
ncbi:MAG: DUF512 domain-containing protein [Clostridiales bacterium]|jgi:putative radical SAM enzyme (TIGR03279 family)|nr:DUF512 domain-containing protein [Clostridiales bacterium]